MRNDILDKLRDLLSSEIDTECKAVYLLCEMRKLLDSPLAAANASFTFKLFCNWALHVDLEREGTTKQFLQQIDAFLSRLVFEHGLFSLPDEKPFFLDLVNLNTFRQEFEKLLKAFGLPLDLCGKDSHWLAFLKTYAGVIEDGSLACKATSLKMFKKITFSKTLIDDPNKLPFGIKWTIQLKPIEVFRKSIGSEEHFSELIIELQSDGKIEGPISTFVKMR